MNYDRALERKTKDGDAAGLWDWTSTNDDVTHRAVPCSKECEHHSKEEAERHFYNYSLDRLQEFEANIQEECAVCEVWTSKGLTSRGFHTLVFSYFLCDVHRHRSEVEKLRPFESDIYLVHS